MINKTSKNVLRKKRHFRIRRKVSGTATRPRLNIYRSNKNIFAQIIDDNAGNTIVSANSVEMKLERGSSVEAAEKVGSEIAKLAKAANVTEVVFDRGDTYTMVVSKQADAARAAGLEF